MLKLNPSVHLKYAVDLLQKAAEHVDAAKRPDQLKEIRSLIRILEQEAQRMEYWSRIESTPYYGG